MERTFRNPYIALAAVLTLSLGLGLPTLAQADTLVNTVQFFPGGTDPPEALLGWHWGVVNFLGSNPNPYDSDYVRFQHAFTLPSGTITSATLQVFLRDDPGEPLGSHALVRTEDGRNDWCGTGALQNNCFGVPYIRPVTISALMDGVYIVNISNKWDDDFYVDASVLTIYYEPSGDTTPIPEPSTMALLGSGLIGLAGYWRRFLR